MPPNFKSQAPLGLGLIPLKHSGFTGQPGSSLYSTTKVNAVTDAQFDRLAVTYIAASVRLGQWLIPGFHGVIDFGLGRNDHDDPQNFDLNQWAGSITRQLAEI